MRIQPFKYHNNNCLLILNQKGNLKQLFVPFKVKCINYIEGISPDTWVYVDQVSQGSKNLILFQVFNTWVPYYHFQIIINF